MWPLVSQRPAFTFESQDGHIDAVIGLYPLEDGTVVSYSMDKLVKRWCLENEGRLLNTYYGHRSLVSCVADLGNDTFATGAQDVIVWNKKTGETLAVIEITESVSCLLKLKDGRTLLCGTPMGDILEIDLSDYSLFEFDKQHTATVTSLCELPDDTIISSSDDGSLCRWKDTWDQMDRFEHGARVLEVVLLSNKQQIASLAADHSIKIWNLSSLASPAAVTLTSNLSIGSVVEVPTGAILSSSLNEIRVWSLITKDSVVACKLPYKIVSMTMLLNAGLILIGVKDGRIEARKMCFQLSPFRFDT